MIQDIATLVALLLFCCTVALAAIALEPIPLPV